MTDCCHWAAGGETKADELLTLCTWHHTLVHEGGFRIQRNFADERAFYRPDGNGDATLDSPPANLY